MIRLRNLIPGVLEVIPRLSTRPLLVNLPPLVASVTIPLMPLSSNFRSMVGLSRVVTIPVRGSDSPRLSLATQLKIVVRSLQSQDTVTRYALCPGN